MATHTLALAGTLTCVAFSPQQSASGLLPADLATIAALIKSDSAAQTATHGAFTREGHLFVPGRGDPLVLKPGDVVAVTSTGFPILVSAYEIASGTGWTFT
jgi:hypothetical protein